MKSTRDTRKVKEEQTTAVQSKKMVKGDDASKTQRAAFGDLTNAVQKNAAVGKKEVGKKARAPAESKIKVYVPKARTAVAAAAQPENKAKKTTVATATTTSKAAGSRVKPQAAKTDKKKEVKKDIVGEPEVTSEVKSSQESHADASHNLSDMVTSDLDLSIEDHSRMSLDQSILESSVANQEQMPEVPASLGVENIDAGDLDDLGLVALYAHDIFKYYKQREESFRLSPYMTKHPEVTQRMRAVLVDWMVEVQENFELNHETLYLAVKLVDTYLSLMDNVQRDCVQILGAVALFLASKFDLLKWRLERKYYNAQLMPSDTGCIMWLPVLRKERWGWGPLIIEERMPPAIDDFIYICDHAFNRDQFMAMERALFRTVGFDLGRPISYRFLRRYAKCGRSETKTLYLARFMLEFSLMEYKFAFQRDSMLAASVLYMARRMRDEGGWTPTLEYYTGYKLKELKPLIKELNLQLTTVRHPDLRTIRQKYQHHLFHSVALIPFLTKEQLFPEEEENVKASQDA